MAIFRWPTNWLDPFGGLRHLQREMERLVGNTALGAAERISGGSYPAINVLNGPNEMIVQCELAGVARDDVELTITGETLIIKGNKKPPAGEDTLRFQRRERGVGEFRRTIVLPDKVDAGRVEADLADGVLTVKLPKSEAAKPRQIPVR